MDPLSLVDKTKRRIVLAEEIKRRIAASNLSVRALAKLAGVPQPTAAKFLAGIHEPRLSVGLALARAVGIRPQHLYRLVLDNKM